MNQDGTFRPYGSLCRPQGSFKSCDVKKYFTRSGQQYPFTNRGGLWGPNWKVQFELFINSYTGGDLDRNGYANIFHITATGGECCAVGDRYPAFLINKRGFIHFATQIGDKGNAYWDSPNLPPGVWYGIEAEQSFKNGKVRNKIVATFVVYI